MKNWLKVLGLGAVAAGLSACVTAATMTIENRLEQIGMSPEIAGCMAGQLRDRLSSEDLQDVARYTVGLSRAETSRQALEALARIDNPRAVAAIGASGVSCIFAPR